MVSREDPGPGSCGFDGVGGGGVRGSTAGGDGLVELRFALIAARPVLDP
jgi:hypothetical protein